MMTTTRMIAVLLFIGMSSSSAMASDYELCVVEHKDIDQALRIGSDATHTPDSLQGLWWMDGNPLPDEVVSFAGAEFIELMEDGVLVGYRAIIKIYGEGVWSWHHSREGYLLYGAARATRAEFHIEFNPDFTFGQVMIDIGSAYHSSRFDLPPSDATLVKVNDDEYRRDTMLFGKTLESYRFRRIVDGDGNRLDAYQDFVAAIDERGPAEALLPFSRLDDDGELPSVCID
ncbi:MAG: hypothetical protein MJE77_06535 [Proteobacteria bacterium]|nr:hypothetical protein [Pseudomonadota bacterium]